MRVYAIRHGESEANLAFKQSDGVPLVYGRGDHEVTLTELGRRQAVAVGRMLAALPADEAPELVWCSPYRRALDTWALAQEAWGGPALPVHVDERLRDIEMGELAGHNQAAVERRFPGELERRENEGFLNYRAPGGESHLDVAVRLRAALEELAERASGRRVLIVAHDSVVLMLRQAISGTLEPVHEQVLNCSLSSWRLREGRLEPALFNDTAHLSPDGRP